jgi:hypothetical protein
MRILWHSILCALNVIGLVGVLHAQTFRDVSTEAGFFGENSSWGAGWADYDRDGDLDVLTLGHLQKETFSISQLWRNNGDGTFTDVTVQAGLIPNNGDVHGVAWADFDNDGYVDIFIGKEGPKNPMGHEVWRNNGDGTFTNVARAMGLSELHHGKGISGVDYDLDGDLDFLMLDGVKPFNHLYRNDVVRFTEVATEAGVVNEGQPNRSAAWADFNGDNLPDVIVFAPYILAPPSDPNAPFCALFVNRGDGTFADGTVAAGIRVVPTCAAGAWGDYDNDGDLDLYITMSENIPGTLYRNNGNGTFTDVTEASGALNASDARGVVWGDYDNDGDLDLYVVNVANEKTPNRLYRNNGDGTFTDVTAEAGVEVQVEGGGVDASFADYNRDGFLDLFVTNGAAKKRGPYVLLQNRSKAQGNSNHWLKVRLVGRQSNRDGLMTKVWAATAQGTQFREHTGPGHYMSQDRMPLHFGMGTATTVTRLELSWPSGTRQVVENLAVDQVVPVVEGESIAQGRPPTTAPGYNLWQSDTGEWHLRWYGEPGEPRHQFTGHISTDGVFTAVMPQSFEDSDAVTWDAGTITFSALARDTFDEVVFVTTGTEVRLDLQQDGAVHPRSIRIGRHGIRPGSLPLVLPNS